MYHRKQNLCQKHSQLIIPRHHKMSNAMVRNIHFNSADGTEIEGWVYFPPGFQEGTRYPTILRIHGGPNGMYGVAFAFEPQLLAANGYDAGEIGF